MGSQGRQVEQLLDLGCAPAMSPYAQDHMWVSIYHNKIQEKLHLRNKLTEVKTQEFLEELLKQLFSL